MKKRKNNLGAYDINKINAKNLKEAQYWNNRAESTEDEEYLVESTYINLLNQLNILKIKPLKILDLACGTGNWTRRIVKMGHQVTGVDISYKQIEIAKKLAKSYKLNIKFICKDINYLNFKDEQKFDVIFCVGLIHHISWDELDVLLENSKRWLKEGGYFIITEFSNHNIRLLVLNKFRKLLNPSWSPKERPISPFKTKKYFINKSFKHIKSFVPEFIFKKDRNNKTRISYKIIPNLIINQSDNFIKMISRNINNNQIFLWGPYFCSVYQLK